MRKITQLTLPLLLLIAVQATAESPKGTAMNPLNISIDGRAVELTPMPIQQENGWLVPLESFSELIGAKVEYPEGTNMAVICQADRCVPLKLGNQPGNAIEINGSIYASPVAIAEPFGYRLQMESPDQLKIVKGGIEMIETGNTAGQLAPDFTLPDLNGKPKQLSDFRGKKTLLYLWASW